MVIEGFAGLTKESLEGFVVTPCVHIIGFSVVAFL